MNCLNGVGGVSNRGSVKFLATAYTAWKAVQDQMDALL